MIAIWKTNNEFRQIRTLVDPIKEIEDFRIETIVSLAPLSPKAPVWYEIVMNRARAMPLGPALMGNAGVATARNP
jgi:hypothetical protein